MKKFVLSFASVILAGFYSLGQSVISQWNFNSTINDATTSTGVTTPSIGSGILTNLGGITQSFATGNSADPNTTDNSGCQTKG